MNNGDMPASPLHEYEVWADPQNPDLGTVDAVGLTKREYFAGLAMQGILASDTQANISEEICVKLAVEHADALLAELDK